MALKKSDARQIGREYRGSLTEQNYLASSAKIAEKCIKIIEDNNPKNVHVYQHIKSNNEVSTQMLINALVGMGLDVFRQSNKPDFPREQFDVVILPCLAIDRQGNRVGYGFGGYDKFLKNQKRALKIAICFSGQIVDEIVGEPHDAKPDVLVHELGEIYFSSARRLPD